MSYDLFNLQADFKEFFNICLYVYIFTLYLLSIFIKRIEAGNKVLVLLEKIKPKKTYFLE